MTPARFRDAEAADLDDLVAAQLVTAALTFGDAVADARRAELTERTRRALRQPDPEHRRIRVALGPAGPSDEGLAYGWIEWRTSDVAYLVDFHVPQGRRGSGLADQLLGELIRIARVWPARRLEFQVGPQNRPALAFFRRHGAEAPPNEPDGPVDPGPRRLAIPLA